MGQCCAKCLGGDDSRRNSWGAGSADYGSTSGERDALTREAQQRAAAAALRRQEQTEQRNATKKSKTAYARAAAAKEDSANSA